MLRKGINKALLRKLAYGVGLVLTVAAPLTVIVLAQHPEENRKILILFNNDSYTATQTAIDHGLRSTLKNGSNVAIESFTEYVGNTRAGTGYEKEFVDLLKRKYDGKRFDLIFAVGQFPLRTMLRNREELFPDTPIVSISIDKRLVADVIDSPRMTAVWGEIDFKANLELAIALHPGTKKVAVIQGVSETDKQWAERAYAEFGDYRSKLEFTDLIGLTIPEMRDALARLSPDTIVFFVSSIMDNAGNTYESPDFLSQVVSASAAPIFGTTSGQLGNGIVGGELLSFEALGKEGGRSGLRILSGESSESIPDHRVASEYLFDWRELKRWGIAEGSLPAESLVLYKQQTFWEEYQWYIAGFFLILTAESLLIGFLVYLRYQRREAEAEAGRLHHRLKDIVSNVPGIVWESRTSPANNGRKTTFISDYVQKMLGYTSDEWMRQKPGFGLRIVSEEDRDRVRNESDDVIRTGNESVSEFRWLTKDGRVRWIENHIAPLVDGENGIIGLRGVALDITDRRLAEEKAREAEEKDRALLAAIPDAMFLQSDDGVFLDYHAKEPSELLMPPESFLGKNMRDVLPPQIAERLFESFARVTDKGKPEIVEYNVEIDGTTKWFECRMVRSGSNILSVVRDITDLKLTQLEALEIGGRLITAQEDERARLARELHDDACQSLALLSIELELLARDSPTDSESIRAAVNVLSNRVAELSNDLRNLSHRLHPARLARLGLGSAIRGFCNEIRSAHDLEIEFVEENVPEILPASTSLNFYRIVQEALQNVVKHSRATKASVTLSAASDEACLLITDNGCGFDPNMTGQNRSLGLISMRERVRLLSGEMSIDSRSGGGTRIKVIVPIMQ